MDEPLPGRRTDKRGRRQGRVDPADGPVAEFAHQLVRLKLGTGDPSYERMRTELGAVASKSALSAAARGRELPSWETTWEFVRCLSSSSANLEATRAEWRARWERARAASGPAGTAPTPEAPRGRPWRWAGVGAITAVALLGLLGWLVTPDGSPPEAPVRPVPGDDVDFVDDVTVPDGTVVPSNSTFEKTWALRNSGSVPWTDRYLQRQSGLDGGCRTPPRIFVPPTRPGDRVRISVTVLAPAGPSTCKVDWKMVDQGGREFFPAHDPVFFLVTVSG